MFYFTRVLFLDSEKGTIINLNTTCFTDRSPTKIRRLSFWTESSKEGYYTNKITSQIFCFKTPLNVINPITQVGFNKVERLNKCLYLTLFNDKFIFSYTKTSRFSTLKHHILSRAMKLQYKEFYRDFVVNRFTQTPLRFCNV